MIEQIFNMFSYAFMQRAIIVGIMVCICSSLLGTSLVIKRFSMIGDGLSHVSFGAMAIAAVTRLMPMWVALPIVIIAAALLLRITQNSKVKGDAAIAMISSGALAIGIIIISRSRGMNIDLYDYMFGSILTVSGQDVILSVALSVIVILFFLLLYDKFFMITFDQEFATASGININLYNTLLAMLTAVTIVVGMRLMGTLLISALIVFPTVSAMRFKKTYIGVISASAVLSLLCFFTGVTVSYLYQTPIGASVVAMNIIAYLIIITVKKIAFLTHR